MIELPEATILAGQIDEMLCGKRIVACEAASSPHKFAFMTGSPEMYREQLVGRTLGQARPHGACLRVELDSGYQLVLGGGGERIVYQTAATSLPKKHQLLLTFADDTHLSVSVQGWGSVQLFAPDTMQQVSWLVPKGPTPLDASFTLDYLRALVGPLDREDKRSVKYALISDPGVWGLGNGYLQDILFQARLHPRRRMVAVTSDELSALHAAIVAVMHAGLTRGGRDTEHDLYDRPGGYVRLMDSRTVGQPCPVCGTPIEKLSFLGGNCYLCPRCQS